jgi:predicted GTPase
MLKKILSLSLLITVFLFCFTAGCSVLGGGDTVDIDQMELLMKDAESRISSIDWNSESPGNIRAQLSAAELQFSTVFDTLSKANPDNEDDTRRIYALRTMSCTYLELVSSMRELANVVEHRDNADYYAAYYEEENWLNEMKASDAALASARNKLHSAQTRINGVNMNLVPLFMQADIIELKVEIEQMNILMANLAGEYAKVLS